MNIYKVTDVTVEDNSIKLGWTITNDVTRYAGTVSFSIAFELDNSYKLTTTPATLTVLKGLDIDQTISKQDTAIVSALYDKVNALNTKVDNAVNSMDNSSGNNQHIAECYTIVAVGIKLHKRTRCLRDR